MLWVKEQYYRHHVTGDNVKRAYCRITKRLQSLTAFLHYCGYDLDSHEKNTQIKKWIARSYT